MNSGNGRIYYRKEEPDDDVSEIDIRMSAMTDFCNMGFSDVGFNVGMGMGGSGNFNKRNLEAFCSPKAIERTRKELEKKKAEGNYPDMDYHEGYGDPQIDAEFIAMRNCLHINADNFGGWEATKPKPKEEQYHMPLDEVLFFSFMFGVAGLCFMVLIFF